MLTFRLNERSATELAPLSLPSNVMDYLYRLSPASALGPFETEGELTCALRRIERAGSTSSFTVHVYRQRAPGIEVAAGTVSAEEVLDAGGVDPEEFAQ